MSQQHDVKFHIGVERVVCTCGQDFRRPYLTTDFRDAVSLWGEHLRAAVSSAAAPAECKCIVCGGITLHMQGGAACTCSHLPTDDADGAK